MILAHLYLNDKIRDEQPDLVGKAEINDIKWRIALWNKTTKDRRREYYSGSISEDRKDAPRIKIKVYEFRKRSKDDPDFHSEAVDIGGTLLHLYLSIRPDPDNNEDFIFLMEFTEEPKGQKATEYTASFKEKLAEKYRQPALLSHRDDSLPDEIPF
jgi:hypothetical protein